MDEKDKELSEVLYNGYHDFSYFLENIFYYKGQEFKCPKHLSEWAKEMPGKDSVRMSARNHLKSTLMYAYVMWKILKSIDKDLEIVYISYNEQMSRYHSRKIKEFLGKNPFFDELESFNSSKSVIEIGWTGKKGRITLTPISMETFKRGMHPDIVICDDILIDPSKPMAQDEINKINRTFLEQIMPMPKAGGELHLTGTPQTSDDLFSQTKNKSRFAWRSCPAIINEATKQVLWHEVFPYEKLMQIREDIGEKAFAKEYMCTPVHAANAYFKREQIMDVVNPDLKYFGDARNKQGMRYAGVDIGKHLHPSHIAVFEDRNGILVMIAEYFMDNMDYNAQMKNISKMVEFLGIDKVFFDNTRGEYESFYENPNIMSKRIYKPVTFNLFTKHEMAVAFETRVINHTIQLINKPRMINLILNVTNDLDAVETSEGHGDSFWSISLACYAASQYKMSYEVQATGVGGRDYY